MQHYACVYTYGQDSMSQPVVHFSFVFVPDERLYLSTKICLNNYNLYDKVSLLNKISVGAVPRFCLLFLFPAVECQSDLSRLDWMFQRVKKGQHTKVNCIQLFPK